MSAKEVFAKEQELEHQKLLSETLKHFGFAIGGLGISTMYLILSSVYHFFKAGFGFSIFGVISSSLYCFFTYRSLKFQK